ncbi:MAG: RimK family alpha-L-glutamate ligase [Planctomycetia bacterium]
MALLGEPTGWHLGRLAAAIRGRGHEAHAVRWNELAAEIGGSDAAAGERVLPKAVSRADCVVVRGMPTGALEDVIFRMDVLGRLAQCGTAIVNSPRSLEVAIDKYLSLARMQEAGIAVPRTIVAQDAAGIEQAWHDLGRIAVVKPLFGSRGRGIERLTTPADLAPYLDAARFRAANPVLNGPPSLSGPPAACYLQEFVPHDGWDVRIFLIGADALAMRRVSADDWRLNVSRGARAEPWTPPDDWIALARRAADAVGADIAGVDLLPAADGRLLVLEVNAVPGWRGLEAAVGRDVTGLVVDYLERIAIRTPPV